MLAVRDWGRREYIESLQEMRSLRTARQAGEVPDTLLLVEHPAVLTVGVQGSDGDELPSDLPVVEVERGGKSTYHGPGQLVGYAVVDLTARGRDVRRFVRDLEEVVIQALASHEVRAGRSEGRRGVWVDDARKIASVGIAVQAWTTFHGFAINVQTDLSVFERFRPCGFDGALMTSVEKETGRPMDVDGMKPAVIQAWQEVFGPPFQPTALRTGAIRAGSPA